MRPTSASSPQVGPETLVADCANCVGLCCVALAFARSEDFAFSKDSGEECRNLSDDYRCGIHPALRSSGMKGCTVFDCHGAGQRVTQTIFSGRTWRESPAAHNGMFAVFRVVRQLHEMLWYLAAAAAATESASTRAKLVTAYARLDVLASRPGNEVLALDLEEVRESVNPLLSDVSESVRRGAISERTSPLPRAARSGADLIGVDWSRQDVRGADLRGALLIAADLSGSDLRGSDLLAADLRDANLHAADLSTALFVTQMQLNAADGDDATQLPFGTVRPASWLGR